MDPLQISIASLVIATTSFVWAVCWPIWLYRRQHRPRLTVQICHALMGMGPGESLHVVRVKVANVGVAPLTLAHVKFRIPESAGLACTPFNWILPQPGQLPRRLDRGDFWEASSPAEELKQGVARALRRSTGRMIVQVLANDAAGNDYISERFDLNT